MLLAFVVMYFLMGCMNLQLMVDMRRRRSEFANVADWKLVLASFTIGPVVLVGAVVYGFVKMLKEARSR